MGRSLCVVMLVFCVLSCGRKTSPGVAPDVDASTRSTCSVDEDCELEQACGPCASCPDDVPQAFNRRWQAAHCESVRLRPDEPAPQCSPCPPPPDPLPAMPRAAACQSGQCVAVF